MTFDINTIADICRPHNEKLIAEGRAARLERENAKLTQALSEVRQELWVDYCTHMGRTDTDPVPFNSRPHIRIIDAAIAQATGAA